MGCASSGPSYKKGGVRLMSTKHNFSKDQLYNLNTYFRKIVVDARRKNDSSKVIAIEATVERLVQRLMLGAANLDERFSSMFLVSLNESRRVKQMRFEYLLRIDALSTPVVNPEIETITNLEEDATMPGFVRLKILGAGVESWHEYVDAEGWLRRDFVKAKLANLLATAIKREITNRADDKICVSPGQVVDAEVLGKILKQPDYHRIFYGPAVSDGPLPEPRNHRIAMIEDAGGILLRIGLEGYQSRDVEVRLLIGIGSSFWSKLADYPRRVPLHHCDALLHYTVPQSTTPDLSKFEHELRFILFRYLDRVKQTTARYDWDGYKPKSELYAYLHCLGALDSARASSPGKRGSNLDRSASGMYAVAVGPYTGARCEDRATLWRIRVPAAEKIMNQHYADDSVPTQTESVLMEILYQLRDGHPVNVPMKPKAGRKGALPCSQDRLRVVSRHIVRTVHRWSLERAGPDPLTSWAPDTLSRHVLLALDELVTALKCQNLRCYFHPRCNVMLQCARGGIVHHEDSYVSDARLLESYLATLHQRSFSMIPSVPRPVDVMESELIVKWRSIMASLPRGAMNEDYGYNQRQLEYFSLLLEEVLRAKDASLQDRTDNGSYWNYQELSYHTTEQVENLVHLLKLVLMQARDQIRTMADRKTRAHDNCKIRRKKGHYNTTSHFDYSVGLLIDIVRRDRETANMDLEAHPVMAKMLLRWLYFGMEYDAKILEPILRPYLCNLFNGLHENGWYADSWKKKQESYVSEMQSLSTFCRLVITQEISPANGIVEFLSKGWHWAESITEMIERSGNSLRLILLTPDKVMRYNLTFAENKGLSAFSTWSKARTVSGIARRRRLSFKSTRILDSLFESREMSADAETKGVSGHVELRDVSPLTYVASMNRSRLRQRGPGDLISAMISLSKFRVLQELAAILPRQERVAMLDMIQRVARETSRRLRRSGCIDASGTSSPRETYRPRPESDILDSPPRLSPRVRQRCIIAEHQMRLQQEMREMHDTLRCNVRPRQRASVWDSHSVSSWTSSIDSSAGTMTLRKYRIPIWDTIKGTSPIRDGQSDERNSTKNKFGEMISREESPTWSTLDNRRLADDFDCRDEDRLPSWDALEATLNKKLSNYDSTLPGTLEIHEGIGKDRLPSGPTN